MPWIYAIIYGSNELYRIYISKLWGVVCVVKAYTEEYMLINGINQYFLHYPSSQKEIVIFLHGGAGRTLKKNKTDAKDLTTEILLADLKQTISYIKKKYHTDRIILLGQSWGSVLGTQYVLKYPNDVICYIGNGHVTNTRHEMQISYDKLKQTIENAEGKRRYETVGQTKQLPNVTKEKYFGEMYRIGRLQSKYGQAVDSKTWKTMLKSPTFKLNDIYWMLKEMRLNKELACTLLDYSIWDVTEYRLPVYYILDRDDWQTPSTLATEYFERINAPQKAKSNRVMQGNEAYANSLQEIADQWLRRIERIRNGAEEPPTTKWCPDEWGYLSNGKGTAKIYELLRGYDGEIPDANADYNEFHRMFLEYATKGFKNSIPAFGLNLNEVTFFIHMTDDERADNIARKSAKALNTEKVAEQFIKAISDMYGAI